MPPRNRIQLYNNAIKANCVGSFVKDGLHFEIIRPGYDSQGRRFATWTQFVYQNVPVFEVRKQCELAVALKQFNVMWEKHVKGNEAVLKQALDACVTARLKAFMDGKSGVPPAPSIGGDGREPGRDYPS